MINKYMLPESHLFSNFCKLSTHLHCKGIVQPYLLNGDSEDPLKHDALSLNEFGYHTASQIV